MTRIRLTREQSRDQTRQRLLDAAQALFTAKGMVAASVEDIAEAAGYTRGAFYSNFDSKSELFLELLRRDHLDIVAGMHAIFDDAVTPADLEVRILQYYSQIYRDNKCFLLWAEAKLQAARDPHFRRSFNAFLRETRQVTVDYIEQFSARVGTPLPLPAEQLALGLIALCDGMKFFHSLDPETVTEALTEAVLGGFFHRVVFGGQPKS